MASGLQKQVLSLYKRCLLAAKAKPAAHRQEAIDFVRAEFNEGKNSIKRSQFRTIEFMLRNGEKKLKLLSRAGAVGFNRISMGSSEDTSENSKKA